MSSLMLIVVVGCALTSVQLAVGIAIGICLRGGIRQAATCDQDDLQQAGRIAQRLQALTNEVYESVGTHRVQLDRASDALDFNNRPAPEFFTEYVTKVVKDVIRANQGLQSKLQAAEAQLAKQTNEIAVHISRSRTDPLTGLPNRREFSDRMEERMAAWERRDEIFSLLMLDIDHFKRVNDTYGHSTGDMILTMVGLASKCVASRRCYG